MQETQVRSLCQADPLAKGMATHCSILAWEIPWTEEPGGLWPPGSQRIRHDWARPQYTHTHIYIHMCICTLNVIKHCNLTWRLICMKDKSYSLSCIQFFATPWTVALQASLSGKDAGVGNHSLPQEIFLTQGSNPGLLHCRQIPYHLASREAP